MTVLGNDSNYLPYFSMGKETQLGKTQFSIYARCRWFVFNIYVMATGKMAAFSDLSRKTAHCPSCPPPCFILHSPLAHNLMYFLFSNINLLVISIYSFYVYFFFNILLCFLNALLHYCWQYCNTDVATDLCFWAIEFQCFMEKILIMLVLAEFWLFSVFGLKLMT